ncbi:MAG: type VI secretion system baseplate subunit TssF [Gammaproteobacteria bacterium]|nr:type VI secretion system baseplate subunit TssF [Gammaproteobacteria bacterium]
MSSMTGLRSYFQRELRGLRDDATRFAADHPGIARELGLARGQSRDPQVELLMQSFAYLTGRLNFRLDEDRGLIPNLLLGLLYPHLQAPIPPMAVARIDVKPDGANFVEGWTLKRDRQIYATATVPGGAEVNCRLRTVYDTPLLPLRVNSVDLAPANEFGLLAQQGGTRERPAQSVLRVEVVREGDEDIKNLNLSSLRFHIHGDDRNAYALYELLAQHCTGVAVRAGKDSPARLLGADAIRWLGFDADEVALPASPQTHPGFRLIQEYFAFREKFLFFEVSGLDARDTEGRLQLLFLIDKASSADIVVRRDALMLNCVPLINLYPQRIEPLRLDQREYEYRLVGDASRHRFCEIHTVQELAALQPDGSERELAPYFAAARYDQLVAHDYFYLPRRTLSPLPSVPGTELYLSFLDLKLCLGKPPGDAIVGRALCTNRRLAEHLGPSDALELEGAGPVNGIRLLGKPSPHRSPHVLGNEPWALLAQLSPNFLSLSDHVDSLGALKRMLNLHCDTDVPANTREIDALQSLHCHPTVKRLGGAGAWRGLTRGLGLKLTVNDKAFDAGSALLLGEVLHRFFALFAAINSFTTLSLEGNNQGVTKQWPPTVGDRIVL